MREPAWAMTNVPVMKPLVIHDPLSSVQQKYSHMDWLEKGRSVSQKSVDESGGDGRIPVECKETLLSLMTSTLA